MGQPQDVENLESAVEAVLNGGYRTLDIQEKDCRPVGCREMGRLVREKIDALKDK